MDLLVLLSSGLLFLVGGWSGGTLISLIRMMFTVYRLRGSIRKVDLLESAASLAVLGGSIWTWMQQQNMHTDQMCAMMMPFLVAAFFTLTYITERHLKNLRNIRTIKKNLDL